MYIYIYIYVRLNACSRVLGRATMYTMYIYIYICMYIYIYIYIHTYCTRHMLSHPPSAEEHGNWTLRCERCDCCDSQPLSPAGGSPGCRKTSCRREIAHIFQERPRHRTRVGSQQRSEREQG